MSVHNLYFLDEGLLISPRLLINRMYSFNFLLCMYVLVGLIEALLREWRNTGLLNLAVRKGGKKCHMRSACIHSGRKKKERRGREGPIKDP